VISSSPDARAIRSAARRRSCDIDHSGAGDDLVPFGKAMDIGEHLYKHSTEYYASQKKTKTLRLGNQPAVVRLADNPRESCWYSELNASQDINEPIDNFRMQSCSQTKLPLIYLV
jgi:hypothetical protein